MGLVMTVFDETLFESATETSATTTFPETCNITPSSDTTQSLVSSNDVSSESVEINSEPEEHYFPFQETVIDQQPSRYATTTENIDVCTECCLICIDNAFCGEECDGCCDCGGCDCGCNF